MTVITISRQYGSLGNSIANAVGSRLGWPVLMRDIINQAALRAGAPEVALAVIDELHLLGVTPSLSEYQAYIDSLKSVLEELARQDCKIIVGRASQVVLRDRPGVLHVRVVAPFEVRAQRLAERHHISMQAARAQARASDRERASFLKRYFNTDLNDPLLYDLVINTGRISINSACDLICLAAERCRQ